MAKPRVVVVGMLPAAGLDMLRGRFTVEVVGNGAPSDALFARLPGVAAIVANPAVAVDGSVLDAAGGSLAVVANFGVGYDNIDLDLARRRGVRVTNTPGVLAEATAELAVALMLAAGRRIAWAMRSCAGESGASSSRRLFWDVAWRARSSGSLASVASAGAWPSCCAGSTFAC